MNNKKEKKIYVSFQPKNLEKSEFAINILRRRVVYKSKLTTFGKEMFGWHLVETNGDLSLAYK